MGAGRISPSHHRDRVPVGAVHFLLVRPGQRPSGARITLPHCARHQSTVGHFGEGWGRRLVRVADAGFVLSQRAIVHVVAVVAGAVRAATADSATSAAGARAAVGGAESARRERRAGYVGAGGESDGWPTSGHGAARFTLVLTPSMPQPPGLIVDAAEDERVEDQEGAAGRDGPDESVLRGHTSAGGVLVFALRTGGDNFVEVGFVVGREAGWGRGRGRRS